MGAPQGAQFALGKCLIAKLSTIESPSQPSLLALPECSVTRARHRGPFITAGEPESWRLPQTGLVSWTATLAAPSFMCHRWPSSPEPPRQAKTRHLNASAALKNHCAEQGHTPHPTRHHPAALIVFPPNTLAIRSLVPASTTQPFCVRIRVLPQRNSSAVPGSAVRLPGKVRRQRQAAFAPFRLMLGWSQTLHRLNDGLR